ncbi:hypothetical protein NKI72_34470, partial [Mesorhizobium sp. M0437]|uniref:hypothetical protein n=1 Tax=Mesorhizobium sp. M0437 TaxID=2956945 RepID=UPI00333713DE
FLGRGMPATGTRVADRSRECRGAGVELHLVVEARARRMRALRDETQAVRIGKLLSQAYRITHIVDGSAADYASALVSEAPIEE